MSSSQRSLFFQGQSKECAKQTQCKCLSQIRCLKKCDVINHPVAEAGSSGWRRPSHRFVRITWRGLLQGESKETFAFHDCQEEFRELSATSMDRHEFSENKTVFCVELRTNELAEDDSGPRGAFLHPFPLHLLGKCVPSICSVPGQAQCCRESKESAPVL